MLWIIVLNDALGPVFREWRKFLFGVRLPCLAGAPDGSFLRNRAESDERVTQLAYAQRAFEAQHMMSVSWSAIASKRRLLRCWSEVGLLATRSIAPAQRATSQEVGDRLGPFRRFHVDGVEPRGWQRKVAPTKHALAGGSRHSRQLRADLPLPPVAIPSSSPQRVPLSPLPLLRRPRLSPGPNELTELHQDSESTSADDGPNSPELPEAGRLLPRVVPRAIPHLSRAVCMSPPWGGAPSPGGLERCRQHHDLHAARRERRSRPH